MGRPATVRLGEAAGDPLRADANTTIAATAPTKGADPPVARFRFRVVPERLAPLPSIDALLLWARPCGSSPLASGTGGDGPGRNSTGHRTPQGLTRARRSSVPAGGDAGLRLGPRWFTPTARWPPP